MYCNPTQNVRNNGFRLDKKSLGQFEQIWRKREGKLEKVIHIRNRQILAFFIYTRSYPHYPQNFEPRKNLKFL